MIIQGHIDVGQIILTIIGILITIVAWFIKKEINSFGTRLDRHDEALFQMSQAVATVVGEVAMMAKLFYAHKD